MATITENTSILEYLIKLHDIIANDDWDRDSICETLQDIKAKKWINRIRIKYFDNELDIYHARDYIHGNIPEDEFPHYWPDGTATLSKIYPWPQRCKEPRLNWLDQHILKLQKK